MKSCSEYRKIAREKLDGNIFSNAWLLLLVAGLIIGVINSFLSFTLIGTILVLGPLEFGLSVYLLNLVRANEKKNEFGELFSGFSKDFGGNVVLGLLETIFITLWTLLFIIPGIIKSFSYSMAFFIKADHPEYDWKTCIDSSRKMMDGKKWKLFLLDLSFIGWYFIGILCLGVGVLWVDAYRQTAVASFYEDIKGDELASKIAPDIA